MAEIVHSAASPSASGGPPRSATSTSSVKDGEFVVLLGPTGAGKTTTLRLIAGLEAPDEGRITIDGRDATRLPPATRDVAFVFQQYSLYPHYTAFENLAFPLRAPGRRLAGGRRSGRGSRRLPRCCGSRASSPTARPSSRAARCSGSRSAARWSASRRSILMDEPLSSLDAKLREDLRVELKRIQLDLGATILYVTHDQIEAMTLADRIGVLAEGALVQIGTPRDDLRNAGQCRTWPAGSARPRSISCRGTRSAVRDGPDRAATLGVRPEDVIVGQGGEAAEVARGRASRRRDDRGPGRRRTSRSTRCSIRASSYAPVIGPRRTARAGAVLFFDATGALIDQSAARPRRVVSEGASLWLLSWSVGCSTRSVAAIRAHADQLTALDQAIGDGDHGLNMRRGFDAIAAARDELAALPLGQALQKAGMALVMKVGGASGPLYGSLLMAMGKAAAELPGDGAGVAGLLAEGIEAVKKRGRSDVGQKTMLDVLVPALRALEAGSSRRAGAARAARAGAGRRRGGPRRDQADAGHRRAAPLISARARSAISIRAPQSSALLIGAVCDVLARAVEPWRIGSRS